MMLRTVALGTFGPGLREQGTADGRMEGSGPAIQQQHTHRHAERRREGPHPLSEDWILSLEVMSRHLGNPRTELRHTAGNLAVNTQVLQ